MTGFNRQLTNALLLMGLAPTAMFLCACTPSTPMRLGRTVIPLSQNIALDIDANRDGYTGRVAIELDVRLYTDTIGFHASEIDLESVVLDGPDGSIPLDCTVGRKGLVTARAPGPLKPGRYTLKIEFAKEFNRKGMSIYKTEHAGEAYVFTQFEPELARAAFPCWDDPGFKIHWRMTLKVPGDHMAVSNTPPQRVTTTPESKTIRFMRTRPMPSYLLAVATGPLEALDVEGMSVPGRIITARGQKHLAETARKISPPLLKTLEDYFECPYPYAKLDQIAVPEFTWGAMENVGAITYRDSILLKDPKTTAAAQRLRQARIVAHEMAHMWFGNLVTPKWWDDLWLNESFASWMALKVVRKVHPEFDQANSDIGSREWAMRADSAASTRPIRREVRADENMTRLFNAIAYSKGMAILTMVEDWLGEENFRKGMIHYMNQHRWGNADAFDLAVALGHVDDSDINAIVKDFITLPGVPLVKVEFVDEDTVRLTQSRYRLCGETGGGVGRAWNIPVILRYSDGRKEYTQRVLMTGSVLTVKLKTAILRKVDGWLYPNADEKGYYRWALEGGELTRLAKIVRAKFDTRRKLGFLGNVSALFYAGDIPADEFLTIVGSFNLDPDPEVVAKVVELLDRTHANFITADLGDKYAAYLRAVLGKSLRKIGPVRGKAESVHTASLRASLTGLLGEKGGDADLMKLARTQAAKYVRNPRSVDPNLAETFLKLTAITGSSDLFDKYARKFETAKDPTERANYLEALSNFRDPQLMDKALDYAMNGPVKPNRVYKIIFGQAWDEATRRKLFDWVVANYDAIKKRVPPRAMPYYPRIADGRSPELLEEARRFFLADKHHADEMKEELREVTDSVNLRIRLNKKQRNNIIRFLDRFHQSDPKDGT
ncbi:MAG: M1 family metallopeptidase [Phycisphaerae bacterium]|jgi:alanyl aminopeptidase|nr:M1 family metallopeptidase [Phycisphaerae bacterium]